MRLNQIKMKGNLKTETTDKIQKFKDEACEPGDLNGNLR